MRARRVRLRRSAARRAFRAISDPPGRVARDAADDGVRRGVRPRAVRGVHGRLIVHLAYASQRARAQRRRRRRRARTCRGCARVISRECERVSIARPVGGAATTFGVRRVYARS